MLYVSAAEVKGEAVCLYTVLNQKHN